MLLLRRSSAGLGLFVMMSKLFGDFSCDVAVPSKVGAFQWPPLPNQVADNNPAERASSTAAPSASLLVTINCPSPHIEVAFHKVPQSWRLREQ